jgi:hypothetical protein|nr:MAG TPA_asm: DNA-directed RNA polymerase II subunit [Caudoviricetes sp.]
MSDYIDREELIKHIKDLPTWWADGSALCAYYLTKAITSIEEAPAADVQEVKRGEWKLCYEDLLLAEIKELKKSPWYNGCGENYERIIRSDAIGVVDLCIKSAPAVDVQKIKHGKWIKMYNNPDDGNYYCPECHHSIDIATGRETPRDRGFFYCPHCGAKMEKGESLRQ